MLCLFMSHHLYHILFLKLEIFVIVMKTFYNFAPVTFYYGQCIGKVQQNKLLEKVVVSENKLLFE